MIFTRSTKRARARPSSERARARVLTRARVSQTSRFGARKTVREAMRRVPGMGFGAGADPPQDLPTKHQSPDTSPWAAPKRAGALQPEGLAPLADLQVPPNTVY